MGQYQARQVSSRQDLPYDPFPVAPADVPAAAVRFVKRTLLRNGGPETGDPFDDDLARLIVAGVIAIVSPEPASRPQHPARGNSGEGPATLF